MTSGGVGASLAAVAGPAVAHGPPPLLPTPRRRFQPQATTVYCDSRLTTVHCGRSTQLVQFAWTGTAVASHRPPHSARTSGGAARQDSCARRWAQRSRQRRRWRRRRWRRQRRRRRQHAAAATAAGICTWAHTHSTGINILITWYIDGLSPPSLDHSLLWSKITMFDYLQRSYS